MRNLGIELGIGPYVASELLHHRTEFIFKRVGVRRGLILKPGEVYQH